MAVVNGDVIVYQRQVVTPVSQRGEIGEKKTVGRDISKADARLLEKGGFVQVTGEDRKGTDVEARDPQGDSGPEGE